MNSETGSNGMPSSRLADSEEIKATVRMASDHGDGNIETDEKARAGLYWVRSHSHEVLAVGDVSSPEPNNSGVVQRKYFSSLEDALDSWGKYEGDEHKIEKAQQIIARMSSLESTEPHEFFYTVPNGSYVAVVMKNSNHSGRVWLRKTTVHSAQQVDETIPVENKNFFEYRFDDYIDAASPLESKKVMSRPICRFSFVHIPLSGRCDCGHPDCDYGSTK
jgi:hypothetical protein